MVTECDIPDIGQDVDITEIVNLLDIIANRNCDVNIRQVREISKSISDEIEDLNYNINKNKQLNIINLISFSIFILLLITIIIKIYF
tara:strand:- start:1131 stop:1391 length:261 start_codon:yes stop_codon:yes gene_type:complete